MERLGFDHLRYADDFRIFCKDEQEAKKALRSLTALLRNIGLNPQTQKTIFKLGQEAVIKIEGARPRIRQLNRLFERQAGEEILTDSEYEKEENTEEESQNVRTEDNPVEVLETAFMEDLLNKDTFNPTLFHYVLGGLAKYNSTFAIPYVFKFLKSHPEETSAVLKYLSKFSLESKTETELVNYCRSKDAIYEYQIYEIFEFLIRKGAKSRAVADYSREVVVRYENPFWLRCVAIALLGESGDQQDLEIIEDQYPKVGDLEKAVIICSLKKMSPARRNSFYARCTGDGFLVSCALRWVKS